MTTDSQTVTAKSSSAPSRRKRTLLPYVADSILLEESGMPWLVRTSIVAVAVIVFLFVGWSAVTRTAEVSLASGQITPSGKVQTIQHLEGGIVTEILVEEGEIVEPGQILVKLEASSVGPDLALLTGRFTALSVQAERLRAFIDNREPDFDQFASRIFGSSDLPFAMLVEDQRSLLASQIAAREATRQVFLQQIRSQKSQRAGLAQKAKTTRNHIALLKSELDARNRLADKGLTSRFQLLRSEQEMNKAQGTLSQIAVEREQITLSMAETQRRIEELDATSRADALTELETIAGNLRDLRETIQKQDSQFQRLDIRTPVRGIIQVLNIHTVGGVINPGEPVIEIVPVNDELVAEVRLSPRDIGHISPGQAAKVKFTTFDFARHGAVDGILKSVSATSLFNEDGEPYFKGIVELDQSYVGDDPARRPITPGMTLSAEILTQDRSLLTYLLKPVYRGLSESFHER